MKERIVVPPDAKGQRLDTFLKGYLGNDWSRTAIAMQIKGGRILLDGRRVKPSHRLKGGEVVEIELFEKPSPRPSPGHIPVIYEDSEIIVINKPAGVLSHSVPGKQEPSVLNILMWMGKKLSPVGGEERAGIVHRLDRGTSGVMVLAKTPSAHYKLVEQFASREVKKVYLLLVMGKVERERWLVSLPVGREPGGKIKAGYGQTAITWFQKLIAFGWVSYLAAFPRTGRTHQIRVHAAASGHPVVGDRLYNFGAHLSKIRDERVKSVISKVGRFLLHAYRLTFKHPASGEYLTLEAPLPDDFRSLLEFLYEYHGIPKETRIFEPKRLEEP